MSFNAHDLFGDFSDNEGFSDEEFSNNGKQISKKLSTSGYFNKPKAKTSKDSWKTKNTNVLTSKNNNNNNNETIVKEIYSGIRLTNPLISSEELSVLMNGRKMVKLSTLKSQINKTSKDIDDDWVTIGIIINKMTKTSKNGNDYSLWKLSDLKSDKTVSFFLFGASNERHWKLTTGTVIGLLNPSFLGDKKEFKNKTEICSLTIDDPDKLLNIGTSKDMGYCKAVKKNGDVCGSLIAKSEDEYCLYHIKNAYRKFSSKRAEIQSNFSNKEPEDYYFANNFTPNVALNQKNIVLEMKTLNKTDFVSKKEIEMKNMKKIISNPISKAAQNLAAFTSKPKCTNQSASQPIPLSAKDVLNKINSSMSQQENKDTPSIARGYKRGQMIDLNISTSDLQMSAAKRRAIELFKDKPIASPVIKANGQSSAPKNKKLQDIMNRVNKSLNESNEELKTEQIEKEKEKTKLIEAALKRKSVNEKVVQMIESEAEQCYFRTLEKKERYENRLADVKQVTVKVITCSVCKYTAVSQSDLCKLKGHEVSFHQATKRFFICKNCKTRTYSFESRIPTKPCKTCGKHSYEKTSIINIKTETKLADDLQIRGEEIKFLNSLK